MTIVLKHPTSGEKFSLDDPANAENFIAEYQHAHDNNLTQFQFKGMFIDTKQGWKIVCQLPAPGKKS
jgi:hypothetical protein